MQCGEKSPIPFCIILFGRRWESAEKTKRIKNMKKHKIWLKCAAVRAVKTAAQAAAAAIGTAAVFSEVRWESVLSTALLAGILSLLTSVAGLPECKSEDKNE